VWRIGQSPEGFIHDSHRVGADHTVGSMGHCNRSLGVLPKGETGYAEDGRFFLNDSLIGQDHASPAHEGNTVEVPEWI